MKSKHQPSGILIVWLGGDDKIHTQSIAIQYPLWGRDASMKQTIIHAKTELFSTRWTVGVLRVRFYLCQ